MDIKFFDIHSHLHSVFFKDDNSKILKKMQADNIYTISVGTNLQDSKKAVNLATQYKNIFATIGIHPTENEIFKEEEFQKLLNTDKEKIVGIGECGLDYFWPSRDLKTGKINDINFSNEISRQKILFEKQINFALKNNLPMMLHIRAYENSDAYFDTLEILKKYQDTNLRVNFHFFTEKPKIVNQILKLNKNYTFSLPGVITFANLDESINTIPIENIMSETDSPFATPNPHRGKTNTPLYIEEIVKKISKVKNLDFEKTNQQIIQNTLNFWNINI